MLVLSRLVGESIVIGNWEVVVTVVSIRGNHVRIGIDAKEHICVDRKEVRESKDSDRRDMERSGPWTGA